MVKGVQIQQKKAAKNELKEIIQKLGALNNALEQTKEPGRHAKIPISRRNRNELYLTKKISIFIRF